MNKRNADCLFEISWEVCNKVGGIYAVIRSKAHQSKKAYRSNYYTIGPYFHEKAVAEFQERGPPDRFMGIFERLKHEGILCRYGKWLIEEEVDTILIDYHGYCRKNNDIKARLWETYEIDSLGTSFYDFDEPIIWSTAVGRFLEEISKSKAFKDKKLVAHFHEWMSCGALLHLKRKNVKMGTVFTTHATMLGRTLTGNGVDLYKYLDELDPKEEAYKWEMHSKHQVERASAKESDVFTTVSEITSIEAEKILGRKTDLLLYNGLNIDHYPNLDEISIKHRQYREKMRDFLRYYFFPYYSFNVDKSLVYFISGRYEFRNKGVDIFIEALSRLNKKMKKEGSKKTIVAFFWIPRDVIRIKPELSHARAYFEDVVESVDNNLEDIRKNIIHNLSCQRRLSQRNLFSEEFITETKKKVLRFGGREGNPPLCTHDLPDEDNDAILCHFKKHGLLNRKEDKVKVIFYPIYLTGADNLLDLNYNESILGSHLGVFPSFYEPWGYTPLETAALGVASITTDLGGFGRYISGNPIWEKKGIFVVDIFNKSRNKKISNLYEILHKFSKLSTEERMENKVEAHHVASLLDWNLLITNYIRAHNLAVKKAYS